MPVAQASQRCEVVLQICPWQSAFCWQLPTTQFPDTQMYVWS